MREGTALPFRRRILSEEKLLELVEKMRSTLPEEVGRAKLIAKDKDRVIREAQERAQAIVSEASEHHAQMVDSHEIVQQARATADVVLREAEERARRVREGADQYAAQILTDLHGRLSVALGSVQKGREALAGASAGVGNTAESRASLAITAAAAQSKRAAFDAQAALTDSDSAQEALADGAQEGTGEPVPIG
ncbi:MAG: hypothetical protein JOY59_07135 [Candidatus Eremiobacteraeota bacterium]|nr:hypothetical protein [Candidatus Eremiobacteraeota bacterium]